MPCIYSGIFKGKTHFKRRCSVQSEKRRYWQSNLLQMDMLEKMLYQELTEGTQYWCLIFSKQNKLPAFHYYWAAGLNREVELLLRNHSCKVLQFLPRLASDNLDLIFTREHLYIPCLLTRAFSTSGQRNPQLEVPSHLWKKDVNSILISERLLKVFPNAVGHFEMPDWMVAQKGWVQLKLVQTSLMLM